MPAQLPFIPVAEPCLGEREVELVTDCVRSGWVSSIGSYVTRFEQEFAGYCGAAHGVATSNGTTALHLALEVLGIGAGDEVIVPALTFIATANAVTYTGARPVFADSSPATWTLDPEEVRRRITPRTRAIIVVHLYGHPADMDPLLEIGRQHGIVVIEDAAEAHGARYKGRRVGGLADMGVFSFYGNKIITTGEGGMIVTDNSEWAGKAAWLRDHGMSPKKRYWHDVVAHNYRLTNLQAALGVAQLEQIDDFIAAKRRHAGIYAERLRGVPGVVVQPEAEWAWSVYWMHSILLEGAGEAERDAFMAALRAEGVDSRPFFYPLHVLPPYAAGERLPAAEALAAAGLNLPSGVRLADEDVERVCAAVERCLIRTQA